MGGENIKQRTTIVIGKYIVLTEIFFLARITAAPYVNTKRDCYTECEIVDPFYSNFGFYP